MKNITVKTSQGEYDIIIENGSHKNAAKYFTPRGKVLVVTDSGVPKEYAKSVSNSFLSLLFRAAKKAKALKH